MRWRLLLAIATIASACTPSERPSRARAPGDEVAGVGAPVGNYTELLAAAREASARAAEVKPPAARELDVLQRDEAALSDALRRWATSRAAAVRVADDAYGRAFRAACCADEEVTARIEAASLWLDLQEDVEIAVLAAVPERLRGEPELVQAVQRGAAQALGPARAESERHAARCGQIAALASQSGDAVARCRAVDARLAATAQPHPHVSGGEHAAVDAGAPAAGRGIVATTRPRPCVYRGSLLARASVYDAENGGEPAISLGGELVEVDELVPPRTAEGRYRVTLVHPVARTGWLEPDEPLFVVKRQLDLVPGHVWIVPGERVYATEARGPTTRVLRRFAPASRTPAVLDRRLFCHDLDLATTREPPSAPPAAGTRARAADGAGPLKLLAAPRGREVARFTPGDLVVVAEQAGFAHVNGAAPFVFDGWVTAASLAR